MAISPARLAVVLMALSTAISVTAPARADGGAWHKVYDRPAPYARAIAMFDDAYGLAVVGDGVERTVDGGATWNEMDPGTRGGGGHIAIADRQHAWVAGDSGVMLRTDDGGVTWRRQATGTQAHFNGIAAMSADEAWATAFGEGYSDVMPFVLPPSVLLHTVDAGATWSPVRMSGYGLFRDVSVAGGVLWLTASPCFPGQPIGRGPGGQASCADRNDLLSSSDHGRTWDNLRDEPGPTPAPMRFSRVDALRAFAVSESCAASPCADAISATTDGGRTWQARPALPASGRPYVGALWFGGPDEGWATLGDCAADCTYSLAHTTDGARTWQTTPIPTAAPRAALAVTPARVLVGTGETGLLRYERASGAWQAAATDARPVLDAVAFTSATRGYGIAGRALWVSDDGGATWRPGPPSPPLVQVVPVASTLWALGEDGHVLRSDDDGSTWRTLDTAPGPPFGGLQAFDGRRAWVTLADGLWRTDDGGASWRRVDAAAFAQVRLVDRDHGWTGSCARGFCEQAVRVTSDGGDTWQTRALPPGLQVDTFLDGAHGWGSVTDTPTMDSVACPCVAATADGARTWRASPTAPWHLNAMTFADARRGWAIAWDSRVASPESPRAVLVATRDGGRTWTPELEVAGFSGRGVTLAGGSAWLHVTMSTNPWQAGRIALFRLDGGATPRLTAPDTGAGPGAGGVAPAATLGLVLAGGALVAAGWARRRALS